MFLRNSLNLPHHLYLRELNLYPGIRHPVPSHFLFHEKNIYKCVTPRMTVINVEIPEGYLRKFTPDGQRLISFTDDKRGILIYLFMGMANVAYLLAHEEDECVIQSDETCIAVDLRQRLFDIIFCLEHHVPLVTTRSSITREYLNREFSLFLDNGRYILLASTTSGSIFPNYFAYRDYPDLYDDTELHDYTFFLVHVEKGIVTDTHKLNHDFVILSHHHSVSLYDHTLAIFSTYRQCIEIIDVNFRDGKLKLVATIGPYGSDFDRERVLAHQAQSNFTFNPNETMPLSHLKQKMFTYMYQERLKLNCLHERQKAIRMFYKDFPQFERMIISKMQLVDNDYLLLRYEQRPTEPDLAHTHFKLFVFYHIYEQEIVKIFPHNSLELVHIVRNHCDDFRNVRSLFLPWHSSSPSNSEYFRSSFDQAFKNFSGGISAAIKRFNSTLPISSQSFSTCPYLDYSIFSYDDRYISSLERPRIKGLEPLDFYDRQTGNLIFRIHLEEQDEYGSRNYQRKRLPRDLVSFIFHPFEPFFISVQKFMNHYIINFHLHNPFSQIVYVRRDYNDYSDQLFNDEIINVSGE